MLKRGRAWTLGFPSGAIRIGGGRDRLFAQGLSTRIATRTPSLPDSARRCRGRRCHGDLGVGTRATSPAERRWHRPVGLGAPPPAARGVPRSLRRLLRCLGLAWPLRGWGRPAGHGALPRDDAVAACGGAAAACPWPRGTRLANRTALWDAVSWTSSAPLRGGCRAARHVRLRSLRLGWRACSVRAFGDKSPRAQGHGQRGGAGGTVRVFGARARRPKCQLGIGRLS